MCCKYEFGVYVKCALYIQVHLNTIIEVILKKVIFIITQQRFSVSHFRISSLCNESNELEKQTFIIALFFSILLNYCHFHFFSGKIFVVLKALVNQTSNDISLAVFRQQIVTSLRNTVHCPSDII